MKSATGLSTGGWLAIEIDQGLAPTSGWACEIDEWDLLTPNERDGDPKLGQLGQLCC